MMRLLYVVFLLITRQSKRVVQKKSERPVDALAVKKVNH